MEFTRAFWNEEPDRGLVERHERYVFPLLRRRHLFARAERFRLYDLVAPEGWVNEDVFAYSNASGGEHSLVLYHNANRRARGWIRESAAYAEKTPGGKRLARCTLAEGLGIGAGEGRYVTFREHGSGLEYLRSAREVAERGLAVDLAPYGCQVFLDFAEVADDTRASWSRLCARLDGRPVPSLGRALREMELAPVRDAFRETLAALRSPDPMPAIAACARFAEAAAAMAPGTVDAGACSLSFGRMLRTLAELARWKAPAGILAGPGRRALSAAWAVLAPLGAGAAGRIDEWLLGDFVRGELTAAGCPGHAGDAGPALLALLLAHPAPLADRPPARGLLSAPEAEPALRVNTFDSVRWFDRECFELLADLLAVTGAASALAEAAGDAPAKRRSAGTPQEVTRAMTAARRMRTAAEASGWRWDGFRASWLAAAEPRGRKPPERKRRTSKPAAPRAKIPPGKKRAPMKPRPRKPYGARKPPKRR
jgi:hypothetical protein